MKNNSVLRTGFAGALLLSLLAGCDSQKTAAPINTAPAAASTHAGKVNWPAIKSAVKKDPAVETRIDGLLARMTLEEKIGQLIQPEIKHLTPEDVTQDRKSVV